MIANTSKDSIEDYGIISLMYHRFNENKYPSTNIRMNDFIEHLDIIEKKISALLIRLISKNELKNYKNQRKILNY